MRLQALTMVFVLAASLAVLGGGCVDAPPEGGDAPEMAWSHHAIQGGRVDNESTAVFGIGSLAGGGVGFCSGSLIAPNLVLTAQHCIAESSSERVRCDETSFNEPTGASFVYLTPDTNISLEGNFYGAREVLVPEGGNSFCGYDIALVILRENVPPSVAVPMIPRIDEPVVAGEVYTAIGYGSTGDGGGSGTRRILTERRIECNGPDCPASTSATATEFAGDDGVCQGDSGGPALDVNGRVLGALSRGSVFGCSESIYSSVWGWSDWIREVGAEAAALGGYEPSRWVTEGTSVEALDRDRDEVLDEADNCPDVANADQADQDGDGAGDLCDPDVDGDGVANEADNCPGDANPQQEDRDGDGVGDLCSGDVDGDGVADEDDSCPMDADPDEVDTDGDGVGDVCDEDDDNDGFPDEDDNCPTEVNRAQLDRNLNGIGDSCEASVGPPDGGGCAAAPGRDGSPSLWWVAALGFLVFRRR